MGVGELQDGDRTGPEYGDQTGKQDSKKTGKQNEDPTVCNLLACLNIKRPYG